MSIFDQAMHRSVQWQDWRWQQKNAIRDEPALRNACGGWDEATTAHIEHNLQDRKMQITPYYIDLNQAFTHQRRGDGPPPVAPGSTVLERTGAGRLRRQFRKLGTQS
ncbi:hypothetical protein [Pseudomonas sp. SST3]|uniref:hypothetical protein n=1 Tax=Pseudomonas sp. SST3 TaxID=2267882 RepID=UPI001F513D59|nr:hypothetical protein [Pseudomonas sp. SST3]